MENKDELKETDIKNRAYYYYFYIDFNDILLDEKS